MGMLWSPEDPLPPCLFLHASPDTQNPLVLSHHAKILDPFSSVFHKCSHRAVICLAMHILGLCSWFWQLRIELFFCCYCCCCSQCVCHWSTGSLLRFHLIILCPAPLLKECMSPRSFLVEYLWFCVENYTIRRQGSSDFFLSNVYPLYILFWFRVPVQY